MVVCPNIVILSRFVYFCFCFCFCFCFSGVLFGLLWVCLVVQAKGFGCSKDCCCPSWACLHVLPYSYQVCPFSFLFFFSLFLFTLSFLFSPLFFLRQPLSFITKKKKIFSSFSFLSATYRSPLNNNNYHHDNSHKKSQQSPFSPFPPPYSFLSPPPILFSLPPILFSLPPLFFSHPPPPSYLSSILPEAEVLGLELCISVGLFVLSRGMRKAYQVTRLAAPKRKTK